MYTPRETMLAVVGGTVGIVAGHDARYVDLIAPQGEPPPRYEESGRQSMARMSGCGLVALGWLRRWFNDTIGTIPEPLLLEPYISTVLGAYHQRNAIEDLVAIAMTAGAWRWRGLPRPGDLVVLQKPEHVFCATVIAPCFGGRSEWERQDDRIAAAFRIESVDGGQRDPIGSETITRKVRRADAILHANAVQEFNDEFDPAIAPWGILEQGDGRRVDTRSVIWQFETHRPQYGTVDLDQLAAHYGVDA